MNKLGFSDVWTGKIMACISSVSYSFQLNGQRFGHVTPSRGICQGDPLSPYLFLLCGEGLSSLLHHSKQFRILQGLRSATGQMMNLSKSAVFFGPALSEEDATSLVALLGVPRVRCHEKYLGLPCYSGKNKHGLFSSIKDRVWNKLCNWKSKLLSAGGREILSKAVIQAIPAYAMNLFKLPFTLIKELHRLCAQFWWGVNLRSSECIGAHGRNYVAINLMEEWVFEI
ncbi:hypothetical protein UlMin_003657 [Ulmus minor]